MFATSAPWSAAQVSAEAMRLNVEPPAASVARIGITLAPYATPTTPMPLLPTAAIVPATAVPWPCTSLELLFLS